MLHPCDTCWPLKWVFVAKNEELAQEAETIPPKAKCEQRDLYCAMSPVKEHYLQCPNSKRFLRLSLGLHQRKYHFHSKLIITFS